MSTRARARTQPPVGSLTKSLGMVMMEEILGTGRIRKEYCMRGVRLEVLMMGGGEFKVGGVTLQLTPEMGLRVLVRILPMEKRGMLILRTWVTMESILNR